MNHKRVFSLLSMILLIYSSAAAYHPLITDDSGTQGRGNAQLELGIEYAQDKAEGITSKETLLSATVAYGLIDSIDIILGIPYLFVKETGKECENGISDISIEIKCSYGTINNFNLAIKPGITIPSGDDEKGFGTAEITATLFLIIDREFENTSLYFNAGYIRNENKIDERKNLWHISLAGEYRITDALKLVVNAGMEKNPEEESSENPAFLIGGLVYSVIDNLNLDIGVKTGLNSAETDYTLLTGITLNF